MRDTRITEDQLLAAVTGRGPDIALGQPIWLKWRKGGKAIGGGWYEGASFAAAYAASREDLAGQAADCVEICLTRDWRPLPPDMIAQSFPNSASGVAGIAIQIGQALTRITPLESIARNRPLLKEIELLAQAHRLPPEDLITRATIQRFEADQFLLWPEGPRCIALCRGGMVVPPLAVGPEMLSQTIQGLSTWMRANLQKSGRMTYKYWPSRGMESQADNTIRQFMATYALGKIAQTSGRVEDAEGARRNLAHNLATYYATVEGMGTILLDGKAKLGAMAIAALCILEFRQAGLIVEAAYQLEYSGLCEGIRHLRKKDGSFSTFLLPADRNDNQNFYPGEAMLFLAALHRQTRDPALAHDCLTSFRYYRDWHLAQPNPAFVPWHVQANVLLYEDLGLAELADFVFQRSDWLLEMQQWGGTLAPDFWGRFYNPSRPDFGPPHASATGVYLEGLAEAWRLAHRLGEDRRAALYALALRRGLRAISQLQFRDREVDAFYLSKPAAVMGGLRTEVYNNEIRVDNVQHCLLALLKIAAEPAFPWTGCEERGA